MHQQLHHLELGGASRMCAQTVHQLQYQTLQYVTYLRTVQYVVPIWAGYFLRCRKNCCEADGQHHISICLHHCGPVNTTSQRKPSKDAAWSLGYRENSNIYQGIIIIIERIPSNYTAAWYGCSIASNLRALQHLVITATGHPSLLDFYNICLVWEATNTVESSTHPSQIPFSLFPSGRRYQSLQACADRPDNSFPHQVLRMLNFLPSASEESCTVIYLFQPPLNVFEWDVQWIMGAQIFCCYYS